MKTKPSPSPLSRNPEPAHTCILFDIDGTLIDTRGAGRRAFTQAICEVLQIDDSLHHISFAGATDLNVFRTVCDLHHIEANPTLEQQFFEQLESQLAQHLSPEEVILLPGVFDLLDALHPLPSVTSALLTGNAAACARLKLDVHRIFHFFEFGAYGDEFPVRADIARQAKARASEHLTHPAPDFIVVGDTPLDVLAAQAIQAPCIAVATGSYSENELQAAGADFVFPDLTQTDRLIALLSGDR